MRLQNREGPGVVGRPTGWDVQAREDRDPAKDSRLPGGDSAQPRERALAGAGAWGERVLGGRMLEADDWELRSQSRKGDAPQGSEGRSLIPGSTLRGRGRMPSDVM